MNIEYVLGKRQLICWFPWLSICGRSRNVEFTIYDDEFGGSDPPLPGSATPRVCHSQGLPLPGSATARVHHSGGDLAPSLGGRKKFLPTKICELRFFRKKFAFSRTKFLMTSFSPFFSQIFRIFTTLMWYMTLSSQEKPLIRKIIPLWHTFLLCSYFRAHPTTLLLKILGGDGRMGHTPTSNFGGPSPFN